MGTYQDANSTSTFDNTIVEIKGGTDQTTIGNVSDRLKVDSAITSLPNTALKPWTKKLRYDDMNATTGGVARGTSITTTWQDVYSYTGSGYIAGFVLNFETFTDWKFRFLVDGDEIFGSNGALVEDVAGDALWDLDVVNDVNQAALGLTVGNHDRIVFAAPLGVQIRYDSSVVVKVARVAGTKKFRAGLIVLSKET